MNKVFKALSDPTRRRVLELLKRGPMNAGELSAEFNVSKPTMSAHFSVLKEADLVEATKVGKVITYQLKMSVLEEALMGFASVFGMQVMAEDNAEDTASEERGQPVDSGEPSLSDKINTTAK
ncbi:autorepressor SdpR family transcription factor [Kordiimonas sp. SCSIO 12610]|uniref:autorepressor SdpR family transcription factor n=1 Tax=Kordiimonas sp. SCSIO 12610 TaxID=2829597 RepID=UPI00210880DE|nr:autorepressor SdpR family transcription factor [Kordiimonas sp. SCSIO 12610]UTW56094.1 winged helix-turn-helix transcriptional regulator [Kordiimonas sp. SCSIO 12610]